MIKSLLDRIKKTKMGPKSLFYSFLCVNIIPNIFLLFTEPYNLFGRISLLLLPTGFYLVLLSLNKRVGFSNLFLLPLFFFHAFQLVVFSLFKEDVVAVDMFLNLVTTNPSEAAELLGSILIPTITVCILYLFFIIKSISTYISHKTYSQSFIQNNLKIGVLITFCSLLCFPLAKDTNTHTFTIYEDVYPANVFYNMCFAINKYQKVKQYPQTSQHFKFHASRHIPTPEQREIYVLVIGETARADNWGLYGYERNTTPLLQSDSSVIYFKDTFTQSNTTHKSVSILLSAASAANYDDIYHQKSIIEAFNETGFTTIFLSNQAKNGSFIEFFAQEAKFVEYYRSNTINTNNLDEVLLSRLEHYIQSVPGHLFIVMHTYGSHFNYSERYPKEFRKFTPDKFKNIDKNSRPAMINAYDNTILYTDYILNGIGNVLEGSNSNAAYLYISDHGEDIIDDSRERFLHASPNPTYYQLRVPFISWYSKSYQKSYPEKVNWAKKHCTKAVSSNMVFHTLLDIASIKTPYLQPENSLVNGRFKESTRLYLGDHDNPIHYYKMNLKDLDKALIERKGLSKE